MSRYFNGVQIILTLIGLYVGMFLGGWDNMLIVLVVFTGIDIATGFIKSFVCKNTSSKRGHIGGIKKIGIYIVIGVAHMLDIILAKEGVPPGEMLRSGALFYYIGIEGLSIFENLGILGVPLPKPLVDTLEQLRVMGEITKCDKKD